MDINCKVLTLKGKLLLCQKFGDKLYLRDGRFPDKILQSKSYEYGYIVREDFVNKRSSSVLHASIKDVGEFNVKDGTMRMGGTQKKQNILSLDIFNIPSGKNYGSAELGPLGKKYLEKVITYIKNSVK